MTQECVDEFVHSLHVGQTVTWFATQKQGKNVECCKGCRLENQPSGWSQ